jgi:di/tricarboxylate transporter
MVSKPGRGEPIVRWIATLLAALWAAVAIVIVPFGCAVGEFEEDRDCTVPEASVAAAVVLVAGVALGLWRHDKRIHWIAIALSALLALSGFGNA